LLFEHGWRVSCDPQGLLIARRETVVMPELRQ
jgi:hypothetical protein